MRKPQTGRGRSKLKEFFADRQTQSAGQRYAGGGDWEGCGAAAPPSHPLHPTHSEMVAQSAQAHTTRRLSKYKAHVSEEVLQQVPRIGRGLGSTRGKT